MKSFAALCLAVLLLSGCNDSKLGSTGDESGALGGGSPGARTSRREDSPRTRLAAVKSHSAFATLAQRAECDANQKTVRATFHTAEFRLVETLEHIGEIQCNATMTVLIDEASGMLKSVTECDSPNYTGIANTSDYTVVGNTLRIGKVGTVEIDADGKTLLFTSLGDPSAVPSRLTVNESRTVSENESSAIYSNFCR